MISTVVFEIRSNVRGWSDQDISFSTKETKSVSIKINDTKCTLSVDGNSEKDNYRYIILIWELLAWEDGYFYSPVSYYVDGSEKKLDELLSTTFRITDKKWISGAISLCRSERQVNENVIENYINIRCLDRKDKSMNAAMFSSFFYLLSESYADINLEHRLVLLMHICDGFAIKFCNGSEKNNSGNINIILKKLDSIKYKNGASLLGIEQSKAMNALGETRNELTHYLYKENSLGAYISDPNKCTDQMVNLYAFYVLEVALRIAVLETIGVSISDDIKDYVMDEHLDWIKIEKHLDIECVLPTNVLRQVLEKIQKQEYKP